jgi:putative spermidine/putrescine transport system permease protein
VVAMSSGHLDGTAATAPLAEVGAQRPRLRRPSIAPSAILWLAIGAAYFFIPLLATFLFSLKSIQTGKCCTLAAYGFVLHDGDFWHTIKISFLLALETIVIALAIFVPTIYLIHLELPKLRPAIAFIALVPFVVPPIVMVVGLLDVYKGSPGWFYGQPWGFLVAAYVIMAFPYMFFALDAGFRSIDVHTLTEASQSLGASWPTTLFKVILPNIRSAALAGSFLALAIVMGEFTIANLAQFHTFPIFLEYVNESQPYGAAALTLLSFGITWGAMLGLLFLGRRRGARPTLIAGAR